MPNCGYSGLFGLFDSCGGDGVVYAILSLTKLKNGLFITYLECHDTYGLLHQGP